MTLEEIRKLCDEATPGPWQTVNSIASYGEKIAASRTLIPKLLAVAEAAKEALFLADPMEHSSAKLYRALAALEAEP